MPGSAAFEMGYRRLPYDLLEDLLPQFDAWRQAAALLLPHDHAYGNYVFPDSTVVIQHPATKRCMDENFEDDRRFMLGLMGKGKGIERVQSRSADITVSDMISIDLGGRAVEIRHFGFAQTPGDLIEVIFNREVTSAEAMDLSL